MELESIIDKKNYFSMRIITKEKNSILQINTIVDENVYLAKGGLNNGLITDLDETIRINSQNFGQPMNSGPVFKSCKLENEPICVRHKSCDSLASSNVQSNSYMIYPFAEDSAIEVFCDFEQEKTFIPMHPKRQGDFLGAHFLFRHLSFPDSLQLLYYLSFWIHFTKSILMDEWF